MPKLSLTSLATACLALVAAPTWADEGRLKVATTFTVLADMASNVAGDAADVVSITKPGAEIHGYQPSPRDIAKVSDADLVLWNGLNLELWFAQFLGNLDGVPSVTLTEGITPIAISGGEYDGKPNPHAWMSLDNAMIYIGNIERALSEADPGNAATYAANARAYEHELREAIEPLRASIEALPEARKWLATCEGAFSYLARDLGLHEVFMWPMNADQMDLPSYARNMIDTVRANDVPVVFCESTVSSAGARMVERETDAVFAGILYVDSLSEPDGPVPSYLDLLRVTTSTIAEALTNPPPHPGR